MADLWSELEIGKQTVRNRLGMAPMITMFVGENGTPNDQLICYYSARARGGVGLVVVEATHVTQRYGSGIARLSSFHSDARIEMFKQLACAIKAHGALAILQLFLGVGTRGALMGQATQDTLPDGQLQLRYGESVSASIYDVRFPENSLPKPFKALEGASVKPPRALENWEIEELKNFWLRSVERAKKAGFNGIEIHAAHGLLLADFISPFTNKRDDEYGAGREGRLKLLLALIRGANVKLRDENFLIGMRISADEHIPGGRSLEETRRIIPILVDEGLDYVSVTSGRAEAYTWTFPEKEGKLIEEVAAIKEVCPVPVMCPNIHRPKTAERIISEGKGDIVLLGRSLLADPDWANKAREGRQKEITRCIFCYTCTGLEGRDESVRCTQNPNLGRERFIPEYWPLPYKQEKIASR